MVRRGHKERRLRAPQITRGDSRRQVSPTAVVIWTLVLSGVPALAGPKPVTVTQGHDVRANMPGTGELAENCNTQNEVSIASFGERVVAGWNDGGQCDFRTRETGVSLSGYGYSTDGGETWTDGGVIEPEPGGNVMGDPVLAADAEGTFYYATLADNASGRSIIGVARSTDEGETWSVPVDASPGRPGGNTFQDKPWLAVDATRSKHRGNVYVAWTELSEGGPRRMLFSRSVDGGLTFSEPVELPTDEGCQPFIGTQVAVGPRGEVYVVWIEDRLRMCFQKSLDGGVSFTTAREFVRQDPIGHPQDSCEPRPLPTDPFDVLHSRKVLNGDIRVQEWPSLAVDTSKSPYKGSIYVALPSRGPFPDEADVFLMSSRDGGETWSGVGTPEQDLAPIHQLNDDTTTNDQFHPTVAVGPDGTVVVTWYDRRLSDDPVRENWEIDLFAAMSTDGGQTFGPNFRVSDASFPPSQTNPNSNGMSGCYMGEYNGMAAGEPGEFLVAWGDNRDVSAGLPDPNVYLDRITCIPEKPKKAPTPCRR